MSKSFTITCSGKSSLNIINLHPHISLDPHYSWACALLDFHAYWSVFNIKEKNKLYYKNSEGIYKYIEVEPGL